jgi:hypothetical protein
VSRRRIVRDDDGGAFLFARRARFSTGHSFFNWEIDFRLRVPAQARQ